MNPLAGLLTPLLVLLPVTELPAGSAERSDAPAPAEAGLAVEPPAVSAAAGGGEFQSFRAMVEALRSDSAGQVRIEQRVIIRIAPAPVGRAQGPEPRRGMPDWRRNMFSALSSSAANCGLGLRTAAALVAAST